MECDLAVAQVRDVAAEYPEVTIEIEVKPWLNHWWEALRSGGWHAPIVLVNRKLVSQGEVPSHKALEDAVQQALSFSATQKP